jgi:hypothetical protein
VATATTSHSALRTLRTCRIRYYIITTLEDYRLYRRDTTPANNYHCALCPTQTFCREFPERFMPAAHAGFVCVSHGAARTWRAVSSMMIDDDV